MKPPSFFMPFGQKLKKEKILKFSRLNPYILKIFYKFEK